MQKREFLEVSESDYALVASSLLNKGMSFTQEERDIFHLHGIIPTRIATLEEQRERSYQAFLNKTSDIEKYVYLRDLQDSNETLFYSLLCDKLEEMMPIIYTPTVGVGCQKFSHIYRRPRGLFISYPLRDRIDHMLENQRFNEVRVIVVSDGERILGLGDLGAGGMGIPIGKLSLYTACAGIHPKRTLPIFLDTGTDNPDLINDPLYIGWKNERIRGKEYDDFIDLFVNAVKKRFPDILLQWEDFAKVNATSILERYKDTMCTFNDDVQGTAAVVVSTLLAAMRISGTAIEDHRLLIVGGGSAGCGICDIYLKAMENKGISQEKGLENIFIFDRFGLLTEKTPGTLPFQKRFLKKTENLDHWIVQDRENISLKEIIESVKPTALIGVSGQAGLFTEEIIKMMAINNKRPIIFPLSNPTSCSEAHPANVLKWSDDKAIVGTGSPFKDVTKMGKPFRVDQTNNAYIFPGLGLGTISVNARKVTDSMIIKAADALASMSPSLEDPDANLLPPLSESRKIAFEIALVVAQEAVRCKVADPKTEEEIREIISVKMWEPRYLRYIKKK